MLDTQQLSKRTNHVYTLTSLRKESMGMSHSFQEDRIKEEMLIFNGPITFSYPAAWRMDQWGDAIQLKWMGMGEAAAGVPQRHWLHAGEMCHKERERGERPREEGGEEEEEEEEGGEEEEEEEGREEEEKIQRRIEFGLERNRLGTRSAGSSKIWKVMPSDLVYTGAQRCIGCGFIAWLCRYDLAGVSPVQNGIKLWPGYFVFHRCSALPGDDRSGLLCVSQEWCFTGMENI
ncbi:unnamed protein product [Microthlaspi erraticum]|uniref:Uncharacterized protein n=1 Tax=Microthlaspi erraticum TaxID=1685480 RepID=A0A6D2K3M6_9BRAS|nr:unnamed protein product [Microthlaspi erraticum]